MRGVNYWDIEGRKKYRFQKRGEGKRFASDIWTSEIISQRVVKSAYFFNLETLIITTNISCPSCVYEPLKFKVLKIFLFSAHFE